VPEILQGTALQQAAATQFVSASDPFFNAIKAKLMEVIGPATEKAVAGMAPYIEGTVLPQIITWGGLFLIASVGIGALVASTVCRRQYRRNPRTLRRPRRRVAYAA
jgi:hypothetical protein